MPDTNSPTPADERFAAFKADLKSAGLADPNPGRDSLLGKLGVGLMVAGVAVALYAYFGMSTASSNPLQQRDAMVLALVGLSITIVGSALFLSASVATFLRFWFARFSHEHHQVIERLAPPENTVDQ